jgi:hypothetical protein
MRPTRCAAVAALAALSRCALAQEQPIVSNPWQFGQTAGPNGTDYPPSDDAHDLWIVEDFVTSTDALLTRFESYGTIYPGAQVLTDMTVRIYDDLPTTGRVVAQSTPGSGHIVLSGLNDRLISNFANAYLPAGSYYVVWTVETHPSQIAIYWVQNGDYTVGQGTPTTAWQWNPGLGWAWPSGAIRPVPADLSGQGQSGVNFTLFGTPFPCYPNCDGSTAPPALNFADFSCFLQKFAAGDPYANCDHSTAAPTFNVQDFTCFLQRFATGCP